MRGIDFGRLVAQRRVRLLLNLVDHLPRDSYYQEAISRDRDLAEELALDEGSELDGDGRHRSRPRQSDWSLTAELLASVANRLIQIHSVLLAANGGNPSREEPIRSPLTALEEIESDLRQAGVEWLNQHMTTAPAEKRDEEEV